MKYNIIKNLKIYRSNMYNLDEIGLLFPISLADALKVFVTRTFSEKPYPIRYDFGRLKEFQINLGNMIQHQNFNNIYEVTLQFLKGFNYFYAMHVFYIKFSKESLDHFKRQCLVFKNREWDDIVSDYVDAIYNLFITGIFANKGVE